MTSDTTVAPFRRSSRCSDISMTTIKNKALRKANYEDAESSDGTLDEEENETFTRTEFSLPPVDRGYHAIMTLICGFFVEGLSYGLPFAYSVFQTYYHTHEFQDASLTTLALVGTLNSGLTYIGGGLLVPPLGAFLSLKQLMYIGSITMVIGFLGASFATSAWHLVLTQGVILGIGGSFVYNAFMPFVPMWFFKRRGLATGLIFSGAGVFGLTAPIAIEKALATIGFRWTLRILALFTLVFSLGSTIMVRPRYMPDATKTKHRVQLSVKDFRFLISKKFLILGLSVLCQGIGYFLPNLFVQSYALSVGVSDQMATYLVSIMNAMTIVGQLFMGYVSDRIGYYHAMVISSTFASLSTFLLWRFAGSSLAMIMAYVIVYGIFGSGFSTCFTSMVADVSGDPSQFVLVSGMFMILRGLGNVVGNPLGSVLLTTSNIMNGWHDITYFVGSFLMASAIFGSLRGLLTLRTPA
ncbi:MFS general substrate transporter [Hesseltinella vesiculosa]|uniref:MFS general substrate transporter n=1 Tax=Hesseltinella vesiculosa TaxID=101127 RepID=A0A1X2GF70_9FUNG|nr:MFS general substrate transporter [Hesseltinella vesiculosa]